MAVGRLESSRTETNCPMALWTGPDECSSPRQRLCKADNTSVALSLESPCRAGAIRGAKSWDKQSSFNAVNGRKSSSHWLSSKSSCQHRSEYLLLSQMERRSTVRRRAREKDCRCQEREQRGTMAHEERVEDVDAWWPRTTRSRGEGERARRRGFRGHRHG